MENGVSGEAGGHFAEGPIWKKSYFCGSKGQIVPSGGDAVTNRTVFHLKTKQKTSENASHKHNVFGFVHKLKPPHCNNARQQGFSCPM